MLGQGGWNFKQSPLVMVPVELFELLILRQLYTEAILDAGNSIACARRDAVARSAAADGQLIFIPTACIMLLCL
jgi:hypothetical protein